MKQTVKILVVLLTLGLSLGACKPEPKTPAEATKEAIENVGEAVKDAAEDVGDAVKDSAEEVKETVEEQREK